MAKKTKGMEENSNKLSVSNDVLAREPCPGLGNRSSQNQRTTSTWEQAQGRWWGHLLDLIEMWFLASVCVCVCVYTL